MPAHPFARYRPLIDRWTAFTEALARPLPEVVWTNTLRTTPRRIRRHLDALGVQPTPLPWLPYAFQLASDATPGTLLPFVTGHVHIQEAASLLPVPILDPQLGERVLDLCAAPGNKTAQLAVHMNNRGTVVANDRSSGRLYVLRSTLNRMGIANCAVTQHDGTQLPHDVGRFDRVLVDAPCSCEGTSRKHPMATADSDYDALAATQRALLSKALTHCRVGGRVVYSTCTYAPEENEAVVDAVLTQWDGRATLRPIAVEALRTAPGCTEWNGTSFDASLQHAARLWPHHNNTGGFFVALLERIA
ncbi:RsmB/NOP family class I SAM-dependent RNA methyltransferase [Salisaeta longa]|uniref:RsmB/NOP family class I SAM-dependent RNA methyltransferase n=1 Tax=Salisaeta longa TaxID=503170 RepID=UPI0003B64022|nr:RsmB/NOP family class I SAM-dependent RNA methyltransferase [Salisaeta longa]